MFIGIFYNIWYIFGIFCLFSTENFGKVQNEMNILSYNITFVDSAIKRENPQKYTSFLIYKYFDKLYQNTLK